MTLALGILVTPLAAHAQLAGKVPRIGIVSGGYSELGPMWGVFRHTLRDLGYVEGQNLLLEPRFMGGQYDQLPQVLAELIGLQVDVIVTGFTGATLAAREATSTIPIIFASAPNPVALGLVASLAHPGGNLTGVANMDLESMAYKQIELLKEVVPEATRVVFLANPAYPPYPSGAKAMQAATASLGLQLRLLEVRHLPDDLEEAFAAIAREPPHALVISSEPLFIQHRARIVDLVAKSGLPAVYNDEQFVDVGGLLSYARDVRYEYRRVAFLVDKVLHGAKPADVPVEQPMKYYLAINLKTARALGLTIPPGLLVLADQVLQ
jgi:putative ABC transport system substrate-binding protein